MRALFSACAFSLITFVSSCGSNYIADRQTNPIVDDYVGPIFQAKDRFPFIGPDMGVMGLVAGRRLTVFDYENNQYCSEPSPDVADSLASTLAASLAAAVKDTKGNEGSVAAGLSRAFASIPSQLFIRTQGIQLYRDASFQYCQMFMNGMFGDPDTPAAQAVYQQKLDQIRSDAKDLITAEVGNDLFYTIHQRGVGTSTEDLNKLIETMTALRKAVAAENQQNIQSTKQQQGVEVEQNN